jgi:hypothetical protein
MVFGHSAKSVPSENMADFCVLLREDKAITIAVKSELPELLVTLRVSS